VCCELTTELRWDLRCT